MEEIRDVTQKEIKNKSGCPRGYGFNSFPAPKLTLKFNKHLLGTNRVHVTVPKCQVLAKGSDLLPPSVSETFDSE